MLHRHLSRGVNAWAQMAEERATLMLRLVREFGKAKRLDGVYACLDMMGAAAQEPVRRSRLGRALGDSTRLRLHSPPRCPTPPRCSLLAAARAHVHMQFAANSRPPPPAGPRRHSRRDLSYQFLTARHLAARARPHVRVDGRRRGQVPERRRDRRQPARDTLVERRRLPSWPLTLDSVMVWRRTAPSGRWRCQR